MATTPAPPVEPGFLEQINALACLKQMPTRQEFVDSLIGLGAVQGLLLLAIGVVYLLCGWQVFKILVVTNAAMLGAVIGVFLAGRLDGENVHNMRLILAIAGALLLGATAWPLMKHAVGVMGALAGGFLGYGLWHYAAGFSDSKVLADHAWAGALIGLIGLGLLAFVIFKETIIIFTAVQGALLAVCGVLTMLLRFESVSEPVQRNVIHNAHLLPVLIGVPLAVGLAVQNAGFAKKQKKKAKAISGSA